MKRKVTAEDLKKNILIEFKEHFVYSGSHHLLLKNLIFTENQTFKLFIQKFANGVILEELILKNVELENITISVSKNLFILESVCSGVVKIRFPTVDTQILSSKFYTLSIGSGSESLYLNGTSVTNLKFETTQSEGTNKSELSMQEFEVKDSYISNIFGLAHFLRDNISTVVVFHPDSSIGNRSKSAYRLLKRMTDRSGDTIQSHNFHSLMLENEKRELGRVNNLLLFFQKYSNDHGRDFLMPIVWIIIFNFIFLMLLYVTSYQELPNNVEILSYILSFNPLVAWDFPPMSFFYSEQIISGVDNLRRVIIAVFVYQTISAARRFSFKK